jgi:hypothetical protein
MKSLKLICLIAGLFIVSSAHAEPKDHSKRTLVNQKQHPAFIQLETQYKKNGSLMSSDSYALQAKLDRVAKAIRNFNVNDRSGFGANKAREYAQHEQTYQYIKDDPTSYIGDKKD